MRKMSDVLLSLVAYGFCGLLLYILFVAPLRR